MNHEARLFHDGMNFRAFELLGAHFGQDEKGDFVRFCVWAPNAQAVSVVGDFNAWDENATPMEKITIEGLWETRVYGLEVFAAYQYVIRSAKGELLWKADPYAFHGEHLGRTASKVFDLNCYAWKDGAYLKARAKKDVNSSPMNIYEVNLGSWKRNEEGGYYTYNRLADELVPYVKEMGYTHIEIMPITEYPYDPSWGYQVTGYFSPTTRYGSPDEFMAFVDACHAAGIGVILDWVPAHFPKDGYALYEFDGQPLYENSFPLKMEHKEWGTRIFDYTRNEVQCFLISSAMLFFEKYHIDGIRVDAVAAMLYLDFGKEEGEWRPNVFGGNYNLEAINFLKKLNTAIVEAFPNAIIVAEESSAFPNVSHPASEGGLGFTHKWNMGWMNDVLRYVELDPIFRQFHQNLLTFSFHYAYNENYILPISHDEVVYGKKSLLDKMPGEYEQKFGGYRAFLAYMFAHPGKKLNFMSNEIAQFAEWDYKRSVEWEMLRFPMHAASQKFCKALNAVYAASPELYELDFSPEGFEWICGDNDKMNTLSFYRKDKKGNEMACVINFAPVKWEKFRMGVKKGTYVPVFNSDDVEFGGFGGELKDAYQSEEEPCNGRSHSIAFDLPAYGAVYFKKIS